MIPKLHNLPFEITAGTDFREDPEFVAIANALSSLHASGMIQRMSGNCIGASEMLVSMLAQLGITASIVECQLAISKIENGHSDFFFIGYDNIGLQGEIDTHVVAITKTTTPFLIDASVSQYLPENRQIILHPLSSSPIGDEILQLEFPNFKLNYQNKKNIKLPSLHQKNVLQKIADDNKIQESITFLRKAIVGVAVFGFINFILNITVIIMKIINNT